MLGEIVSDPAVFAGLSLGEFLGRFRGRLPKASPEMIRSADAEGREALGKLEPGRQSLVFADESGFPQSLRQIPDPPNWLFLEGSVECLTDPAKVAVIGTVHPCEVARKIARRIGRRAAESGFIVVSGLARGCDTEAHRGCLEAGGRTIAVMAGGLDSVYPEENRDLLCEIIRKGGAAVSEYPPGTPPDVHRFIERDRLQSGMSRGVVLIQSGEKGGSMHTIRFAERQGRRIGVVLNDAMDPARISGNRLLLGRGVASTLSDSETLRSFLERLPDETARSVVSQPDLGFGQ